MKMSKLYDLLVYDKENAALLAEAHHEERVDDAKLFSSKTAKVPKKKVKKIAVSEIVMSKFKSEKQSTKTLKESEKNDDYKSEESIAPMASKLQETHTSLSQ